MPAESWQQNFEKMRILRRELKDKFGFHVSEEMHTKHFLTDKNPYREYHWSKETKQDIIKCDLCKEEDIPLCVYNCPSGALELQSEEVELSSDVATTSQENIKTYVIVGASIAGITAVKTIRELDKSAKIIVVSKDEKIYSRCMLHHVISEHRTIDGINFVDEDFINKQDATWIK